MGTSGRCPAERVANRGSDAGRRPLARQHEVSRWNAGGPSASVTQPSVPPVIERNSRDQSPRAGALAAIGRPRVAACARRSCHVFGQPPLSVDEPLFESREGPYEPALRADEARARIARLVDAEPYAVLCVQGGGQPYGALVAHAFSDDLRAAVFSTSVATRKYRLLSECDRVALVVDSRPKSPDDLMRIEAVTVTGTATRVEPGPEFDRWARLLSSRHAYLRAFVRSASSALYRVDVVRYLHVARFQEVRQWVPTDRS